jgi:hypothetical protein
MRWAVYMERIERRKINTRFWQGILKDRDHLEDLGLDGRIILKCSSGNRMWRGLD